VVKVGRAVAGRHDFVYYSGMNIETAIELRLRGSLDEAQQVLEAILEETPEDPLVHYHLATTCIGRGDDAAAISHYKFALDAGLPDEEDGQAVLAYAALLRSQRKYLRAARFLQESLSRRPGDDGIRVFLALTQHKLGMHTEAVQSLVRILLSTADSARINELSPMLSFYAGDIDFGATRRS
jgi:thioredoxin-like negative regulator of GroEL